MKVYVIDNGGQWTHREWRVLRYLGADTEIVPNDVPFEKIKDADAIVLSGGAPRIGMQEKLGNIDEYLEKADVPILGICAGHQYMARYFGGECSPAEVPEYGKVEIEIHEHDGIFRNIPDKITVWESHNDEVTILPSNFILLASSKYCRVQAMKHRSKPLFGLQFHPEVEHTEYGEEIFRNFLEEAK
ncbi:MAG: GMP synthase subunit A [Thermoplasmata archaeon]|nr:GMP synthase subunit A [Thermoplasmata archaeon]